MFLVGFLVGLAVAILFRLIDRRDFDRLKAENARLREMIGPYTT